MKEKFIVNDCFFEVTELENKSNKVSGKISKFDSKIKKTKVSKNVGLRTPKDDRISKLKKAKAQVKLKVAKMQKKAKKARSLSKVALKYK